MYIYIPVCVVSVQWCTTGHLQHKQDLIYLTDDLHICICTYIQVHIYICTYIQNQQPEFKKNKLMVADTS
jgi:hypothetical protein